MAAAAAAATAAAAQTPTSPSAAQGSPRLRPRQAPPLPGPAPSRSARPSPCPAPLSASCPLASPATSGWWGSGKKNAPLGGRPRRWTPGTRRPGWGRGRQCRGRIVRPYRGFRTAPPGGHAWARDSSIPFGQGTRPRADSCPKKLRRRGWGGGRERGQSFGVRLGQMDWTVGNGGDMDRRGLNERAAAASPSLTRASCLFLFHCEPWPRRRVPG